MKKQFNFSNCISLLDGKGMKQIHSCCGLVFLFLVLACSWCSQTALAQSRITDKVKAQYAALTNTSIESLLNATDEDDKTFYLYNEAVGQFIGYGGYWDVQAVMSDKAVPFTIKAVEGKDNTYQLTSNRGGNLGFNNGNYSGKLDAQRFFVDMGEDYSGTNTQIKMESATVGTAKGYTMTVVPSGCTESWMVILIIFTQVMRRKEMLLCQSN